MIIPPHHFHPIKPMALHGVPAPFHTWITDQSSLTQRLINHSKHSFHVKLLHQGLAALSKDEAHGLNQRTGALAIVREVELICDDVVCVYARSVIPLSSLKGKQRQLASLGTKPLGAFLFADPNLKRDSVEILPLNKQKNAWGRRSLFITGGYPLYVSEYFLPALINHT